MTNSSATRTLPRTRPGAYVLFIELAESHDVRVGRLGVIPFEAGRYAYVGSARGGLDARVSRHLRREKQLHWHIDYLLEEARVVRVVEFETAQDIECVLGQALVVVGAEAAAVPRFGSSDCRCGSHLYYLGEGHSREGRHGPTVVRADNFADSAILETVNPGRELVYLSQ